MISDVSPWMGAELAPLPASHPIASYQTRILLADGIRRRYQDIYRLYQRGDDIRQWYYTRRWYHIILYQTVIMISVGSPWIWVELAPFPTSHPFVSYHTTHITRWWYTSDGKWCQTIPSHDYIRWWYQAMIWGDGKRRWYQTINDIRRWYRDGELHRTIVSDDDTKEWYQTMIPDDDIRWWCQTMNDAWYQKYHQTMVSEDDGIRLWYQTIVSDDGIRPWYQMMVSSDDIRRWYQKTKYDDGIRWW